MHRDHAGRQDRLRHQRPGTVTPIKTATNTALTPITVGSARGHRDHPGRQDRLRGQPLSDTVTPIRTATNTPGTPITVGSYPVPSRSPRTARPPTSSTPARAR